MAQKIRVAIIGGGIAGCSLFNALLGQSHLQVDIFEKKDTFGERGIGVALHPNGQNALSAMGIDADEMLSKAGAVREAGLECIVGHGEHKGAHLLKLPGGAMVVARNTLLKELLKALPEEHLHANKSLDFIEETTDGPVLVHFEDGSVFEADVVVGCDGIHSKVREIILGKDHEATAPVFGGFWDARGTLATEQAVARFGTDVIDPRKTTEIGIVGDGFLLLFAQTEGGNTYNAIISGIAKEGWDSTTWRHETNRVELEELCGQIDEDFRTAVLDCITTRDDSAPGVLFNQWESGPAPTYYRGRLCMIGDAAHATIPWMGQGASMSLEDAGVIAALLSVVETAADVPRALASFDRVRRGRPEKVVERSREVGKLLTGQMGLDPAQIPRHEMESWFTSLWEMDMPKHFEHAITTFKQA